MTSSCFKEAYTNMIHKITPWKHRTCSAANLTISQQPSWGRSLLIMAAMGNVRTISVTCWWWLTFQLRATWGWSLFMIWLAFQLWATWGRSLFMMAYMDNLKMISVDDIWATWRWSLLMMAGIPFHYLKIIPRTVSTMAFPLSTQKNSTAKRH